MWFARFQLTAILLWSLSVSATILQNGQPRDDPYPGQLSAIDLDSSWRNYDADAPEISYKGRWDSKHISWWSAPGLKVQFSGKKLALSFGEHTNEGTLVAYRIGTLDWLFTNVTHDATYQFIGEGTHYEELPTDGDHVFEMRVTNWGIGVQIAGVSVDVDDHLTKPPTFKKKIEIIGGSITGGQYATYETISSWAFIYAQGLGNVEFGITAYPGACLADMACYGGGVHGTIWWWHRASDPGSRAGGMYGREPEEWDVSAEQPADLVIIQMGGNDHRHPNEIPGEEFYQNYIDVIENVHKHWPDAEIVIMTQWGVWKQEGAEYNQNSVYEEEITRVYEHFKDRKWRFVHLFHTDGILGHNDINPKNHPTDVGHVKIASHMLQWTNLMLGWELNPRGEMQHGTLYWNNMENY
ncbi:SGNH hydrolase-type esterase domain-containing protein [Aspergillus karnatakaensis]|uniref:SGNH/GDSL hydrolase family protein n=1 Tax=Aspergillus karnatakaensis TaxID=1810916 RepID=UPI003CCD9CB7